MTAVKRSQSARGRILGFLMIAVVVFPPWGPAAAQVHEPVAQTACTHIIPPETTEVDGQGNYAMVVPGDTLCLPGGTRPNIRFINLHGTPDQRITIRNDGGRVTIEGKLYLSGGIWVANSSNLHITGTGDWTACGFEYSADEQKCGIEIARAHKGIKLDTELGPIQNIEIDHVAIHEIREIEANLETRGISVHPLEGQVVSGISIHHNTIAGTSAEGIYLGSEPNPGTPLEQLGKLENVDVSYNRVENTDFDGINIKVAVQNLQVHHNIVDETGSLRRAAQQGGIKLAMSVGDVYNNYVMAVYSGIQMGRPLENPGTRYFNNVVVGADTVGIEVLEENALVYNNTVVNSVKTGIRAPGKQSKVFDNIIAGTSGTPVEALDENLVNNFIGPINSVMFVSSTGKDFRLRYNSPAIDAGGSMGTFPPEDFRGVTRPQGAQPDLGAFEYADHDSLSGTPVP